MLLKRASKPAHSGFKRKKLDVMGSYKEVKANSAQILPQPSKPLAVPQ